MDKPEIEGQVAEGQPPQAREETIAKTAPPPSTAAARSPLRYAWWLVLGLVGLDCFSTLGYLPTIAYRGAHHLAPLASAVVAVLMLFVALPVYLYVADRSPHGRGATGLLESHISGWGGKVLVLFLLGFVATDFVMTRSLSVADASRHLLANPYAQSSAAWLLHRKEAVHHALPESFQGRWTDAFFSWWDEQLIVTVILMVLGFGLFFYLLRGFTRGFLYTAAAIVALFLLVNGLVIGSAVVYVVQHPEFVSNWMDFFRLDAFFREAGGPKGFDTDSLLAVVDFTVLVGWFAVRYLPYLVLGLSGFELSMVSAPLVRGGPDDDPAHPRGRIRNMRKLLAATAVLMSVLVFASVSTVTLLVPPRALLETGAASDRALAYLAHGGELKQSVRFTTDTPHEEPLADDEFDDAPPQADNLDAEVPDVPSPPRRGNEDKLNPLFGPAFGTLYDLSAVLILCLAGASVTISLRNFLPQYLTRYGMEMHWARRTGALLHLFNVLLLIVVIAFHASVSDQQWAYATSVLVLMTAAALAAAIELRSRWRRLFFRPLVTVPLLLIALFFAVMAYQVCRENPAGAIIALWFVALILVTAAISRWMRSTELRYYGFTFADEESAIRWEQIRRLEFQVLVPHRPENGTVADTDAAIRTRHRLGPDVPVIFIEAELGDPSDFQHYPLMRIDKEDGMEVVRVSECASIAHVLAAIALEFHEVGRPPEMHFAWSNESPLASNLNFLLWGQGNIPWMVYALIRRAEPDPARQPRVVIG